MNTEQLNKAKKEWGFSMDITLENNRLYVANDGYITDDKNDVKLGKHSGVCGGFYYYSKRRQNTNSLINVIRAISEECRDVQEVSA